MKNECMKGALWKTRGGRITLDNHSGEVFSEPYDKKLMTAEELKNGIRVTEFAKRLVK